MSSHRLRLALFCAVAALGSTAPMCAGASGIAVIGPGDSLDSLARKHHLAKKDIAAVNGLSVDAVLRDGSTIRLPDPPKRVAYEASMRQRALVSGNRVSVRIGPYQAYRRLALLDHGSGIVVTHRVGNWLQVELPKSGVGWVREEYVALDRGSVEQRNDARRSTRTADRPEVRRTAERAAYRRPKREARRHASDRPRRTARARSQRRSEEVASRPRRRRDARRVASGSRRARREVAIYGRRGRPEADAPYAENDVIRTAYAYRGVRYRYSGQSPRGFDCSGFTSYIYRKKGVSLPRTAAEQFQEGAKVRGAGMKPGDLVFFRTTRRGISHVGIYAGSGRFVHASSGGGRVRVDTLESGYYRSRFRGARRVR